MNKLLVICNINDLQNIYNSIDHKYEIIAVSTLFFNYDQIKSLDYDLMIIDFNLIDLKMLEQIKMKSQVLIIFDQFNQQIYQLMKQHNDIYYLTYRLINEQLNYCINYMFERKINHHYHGYMIELWLNELGFYKHLKGFQYLVSGVLLYSKDVMSLTSLYDKIAKRHQTTAARVERCIRHSIIQAYDDHDGLKHFFKHKPKNKDMIIFLSEQFILKTGGSYE